VSPSAFPPVPEQLDLLLKGVEACEKRDELEKKLTRSAKTGKPLLVKVGFDPSTPDLHLGHTVVFRKMRHFQRLGHTVVFLIGDFTGMIGDPTGKRTTRPQLTRDEVLVNAETYKAQVFKILDPEKTRVAFNSEWLSALGAEGLIRLSAKYTVARLLERDDFAKRFREGKPIAVHELLYPLCQGYDSVALSADVELGGTDQLFNLLVGRDLMRESGQEPQIAMTLPLLVGTDGAEKMSKSLGNAIGVAESPDEIFGKVMSISDASMWTYYTLLTDLTPAQIEKMKADVASGEVHPKAVKMDLAGRLVEDFHDREKALAARAEFDRRFTGTGGAVSAEEISLATAFGLEADAKSERASGDFLEKGLVDVLVAAGLVTSKNIARQKIREGAVSTSADGQSWTKATSPIDLLRVGSGDGVFLRMGKKFVRVTR
jgi:tyrosyl-tRNA synthetase